MALAVTVLQEAKQRSVDNYAAGFAKTQAQILGRLRHPSGQLALLNPGWNAHWPPPAARSYCPMPPSTSTTRTR